MVWMGVSGCYLFYGTSLMISTLGMSLIRLPRREMPRREQDLLGEVREGFRYIRQAPVILGSIGAAYTLSVFVMDQGMRSIGSMIMGLFATLFGAALGLALTSILSLTLTSALFYRLLRPHSQG